MIHLRLMQTRSCQPGMRLGKAIYNEEGHTLLGYHVELSRAIINKLLKLGIEQLYIDDSRTEDIIIDEMVRDETRRNTRIALGRAFRKYVDNDITGPTLSKLLKEPMNQIIEDLKYNRSGSVNLMNVSMSVAPVVEEHFARNAMNVCLFATKLGMLDGYSNDELLTLGLGALLHDIGITQVPFNLLLKDGTLTVLEFHAVQRHVELGFNIIKEDLGIPLISAHVALQHHERINGSGYPWGTKGNNIHNYARLVGMLDAYDAMTNPRSYRSALPPHIALESLYTAAGILYDKEKVESFRNKVAIFPVGTTVQLSTGEIGIVSKVQCAFKQRPTVRVLKNEGGEDLKVPYEIDLSQNLHIMVQCIGEKAAIL